MNTCRRDFLKATLGLAAACAAGAPAWSAPAKKAKKIPIGLQLYVLRKEFAQDVPGTLKLVREMGYQGVEFWGYNGEANVFQNTSAQQMRKILDDCGLKCCGIHLSVKALESANLERTIENNKILGNRFLNISSAGDKMKTAESIKGFAEFMNETGEKCRAHKMFVGYHAHGGDFIKIGDQAAWDLLFSQLKPLANMQLDIGNALQGGGDPIATLKQFPGRVRTIHLKSYEDKTFESPYFKEVFNLVETLNKPTWYIVEEGESGTNAAEIARQALATLRRLGK